MKKIITLLIFILSTNILLGQQKYSVVIDSIIPIMNSDDESIREGYKIYYNLKCEECQDQKFKIEVASNLDNKYYNLSGDTNDISVGKNKVIDVYIKKQQDLLGDDYSNMVNFFEKLGNKELTFNLIPSLKKNKTILEDKDKQNSTNTKETTKIPEKINKNKRKYKTRYFNYDDTFFYELNIERLHSSHWKSQYPNLYIRGVFNVPIGTNLYFCTELGYGNLKINYSGKEMKNNFFTPSVGLKYASFPIKWRNTETFLAFYGSVNIGFIFYNVQALDYNANKIIYKSDVAGDKIGFLVSSGLGLKFNIAPEFYINLNYNFNIVNARNFIVPLDNFNIINQKAENIMFSSIGIGATFNPW